MDNIKRGCYRPQPPFGRILSAKLTDGYKPNNNIYLYFGEDAWGFGKTMRKFHDLLILPPENNNPNAFNWGSVNGLSVLAIDTSTDGSGFLLIELLAYELLKYGATVVTIILACKQLLIYRHEEVQHDKASG